MIAYTHNYTVDLDSGTLETRWDTPLTYGDKNADKIQVTLMRGGVPATVSGLSAMLYGVRSDGTTAFRAATVVGNVVTAELDYPFYAIPGQLELLLQLTEGTEVTSTPLRITTYVKSGQTDELVNTGEQFSLAELQAIITECETATGNANDAAAAANSAADGADAATDAANLAAGNAQDAADAITGITAEAGSLPAGSDATAFTEEDSEDGHINIVLGIPRGDKGEQGTLMYAGTAITGTSTTPAAYATGIIEAHALDLYRYNGNDAANVGNIYECTLGGDAATALWAYAGNWRGAPGSGNVDTVDSIQADANGNVLLNAANRATGATAGNFAALDADGNLADSGHKHSDYATEAQGTKADGAVRFDADQSARSSAEKAVARNNILATSVQELLEKTGYGIHSGLRVTAQDTPDMTVQMSGGIAYLPDGTRVEVSAVSSQAISAADATYDRIDIMYLTSAGTPTYLAGTAEADPSMPSVPAGGLLVAQIIVPAGVTVIETDDISYVMVGHVGAVKKLLWKNASPSSSFADQTLSLPLSEYDYIMILFACTTTLLGYASPLIIRVGTADTSIVPGTKQNNKLAYRPVTSVSASSVVFGAGVYIGTYGSAGTTDNTTLIPAEIWGIKGMAI